MSTRTRLLSLLVLSGLCIGLIATPALAHGRGSDASNFLSLITDDPSGEDVDWAIVNSDEYLKLTNRGDEEIIVPGYSQEPYLRVGPDGVFQNRNSQATYLNADRYGDVRLPEDIDIGGDADWEKVSDEAEYAWHDHRIHWMAEADPPGVATDPDAEQVVNPGWTVPFIIDGEEMVLTGDLLWIPGGSPWVWLVPALLVLLVPLLVGLRTPADVDAGRWPGLARPMGATLVVLGLLNLIHLADDLFATPVPLSTSAVSAVQTAFFIAIAIFGGIRAMQAEEGAFTALGVGSGAIFIGQGLLYLSVLSASQTASLFPGWLTRVVVAASVAQVVPMVIATIVGVRRLLPDFDETDLAAEAAT